MNIREAISQLLLPDGSFMVVGSGLLDTLGIRAAGDIDLLVSHDVFNNLKHQNYKIQQHEDGSDYISIDLSRCSRLCPPRRTGGRSAPAS